MWHRVDHGHEDLKKQAIRIRGSLCMISEGVVAATVSSRCLAGNSFEDESIVRIPSANKLNR